MTILSKSICIILLFGMTQVGLSQKATSSTSPSLLIVEGAPETELMAAWATTLEMKKIVSYTEAEELVEQTSQLAYLQGNKRLARAIMKAAYSSTLAQSLSQEIGLVQAALSQNTNVSLSQKSFKMKPDTKDLQKLSTYGGVQMKDLQKQRGHLVNVGNSLLQHDKRIQHKGVYSSKVSGSNQNVKPFSLYQTQEVIASNGRPISGQASLESYKRTLEQQFLQVNTEAQVYLTQLENTLLQQQQVEQNLPSISKKLMDKALAYINE